MKAILHLPLQSKQLLIVLITLILCSCNNGKEQLTITTSLDSNEAQLIRIPLKNNQGDKSPVFTHIETGDTLIFQIMKEDEILLEYDFEASREADINLSWTENDNTPTLPLKTGIHLGYSENKDRNYESVQSFVRPEGHVQGNWIYQAEGPIWENEHIAFRTYFDPRNGIDVFGKTKPQLNAEEIGLGDSYHNMQDWGMDILKVGNSLGAGALGILDNDSLFRLDTTNRAEAQIVLEGPLMSELRLEYGGWQVRDNEYDLVNTIRIFAGTRWYQSTVKLQNGTLADTLITGLVDLYDLEAQSFNYNDFTIIYTHGNQSYLDEVLGLAIIVPSASFAGLIAAPEEGVGITKTHVVQLIADNNQYEYYFFAGWEQENPEFSSEQFLIEQLKKSVDQIRQL